MEGTTWEAQMEDDEPRRALRERLWLLEEVTDMLAEGRISATVPALELIRRQLSDLRTGLGLDLHSPA
jgi:hypothetical protein